MTLADAAPPITLRIPGAWEHPGELLEGLPAGCRLTPENLILPDGTRIEFNPLPPDDQFAGIFASACRRPAAADEMAILARYSVIVGLTGPGGSPAAALAMMQAGAAIVRAGGAGVFIDNCALAHGGGDWVDMTEDGGSDAMSFALVGIVRGREEVFTMGMQTMGFPDLLMRRRDLDEECDTIIEIIRYVCEGEHPLDVGHLLADEEGPRFQIVGTVADEFEAESPMHNPRGRLRIVSMKDVAEGN